MLHVWIIYLPYGKNGHIKGGDSGGDGLVDILVPWSYNL